MQYSTKPAIPVTILSGFLGAGKTTLLNHILREDHGRRIGVLVNDFGAINIDAALIETVEEEVIQLANGCICCTIREDLLEAVGMLLARQDCPEYLVIEASGIADPSAIAFTFLTPGIRESARLDAVVTVVDCEQVFAQLPDDVQQLMHNQIGCADIVVLNKIDLVDEAACNKIERRVQDVSPKAALLRASYGALPVSLLLDVYAGHGKEEPSEEGSAGAKLLVHSQKPAFSSWSYTSETPVASLRRFNHLMKQLPDEVIRVKGFLYLQDMPEKRIIVHRVGKRMEVHPGAHWGVEPPRTTLVAIALAGTEKPDMFK